jgi:hypothetical protein
MNTLPIVLLCLAAIATSLVNMEQNKRIEALEKLSTHQTVEK